MGYVIVVIIVIIIIIIMEANLLYALGVFLNVLASIWYFVAAVEGFENSWLTSGGSLSQPRPMTHHDSS